MHPSKILGQRQSVRNEFLQIPIQEIFARNYAPKCNHATKTTDNNLSGWVQQCYITGQITPSSFYLSDCLRAKSPAGNGAGNLAQAAPWSVFQPEHNHEESLIYWPQII